MTEIQSPFLECDLVMKGGVTSGVIYPSAAAAIAEHYRLRSIGGTSAGAIAAAAAAAMEFGRTSGRNSEAREQMGAIAEELGAKDDSGEALLGRLFEADPETRPLFALILRLQKLASKSKSAAVWHLLRWPALIGFGLSVVVVGLLFFFADHVVSPVFILGLLLLAACLGIVATAAAAAFLWIRLFAPALTAASVDGFGFCSGMARRAGQDPSPALCEWLHGKLQSLAGLPDDEPLTFGDLWIAEHRVQNADRNEAWAAAAGAAGATDSAAALLPRSIDLALVASDVSRAQSVQFPFVRRDDQLYARVTDLERLLPQAVVDWVIGKARDPELADVDCGEVPRDDLVRLPPPEDLPVLLAVRASLSFPVLFKAVRLYVVRSRPESLRVLSELWLADGGLTSNFPIHLFDAPVPTRPTFCINLLYADDELQPDDRFADAADAARGEGEGLTSNPSGPSDDLVYMLRTNYGRLAPYTALSSGGLAGMVRFVMRVVTTARQWNDNQLLDVPGYRDRIVHVRMRPDEGGFNFDMEREKIADLQERGRRAGEVIARRFLPTTTMDPLHPRERLKLNWANHRMARFRSFLAGLETSSSRFAEAWRTDLERAESVSDDPRHAEPSLLEMTERVRPSTPIPGAQRTGYPFKSGKQADLALNMVEALTRLAALRNETVGVDFVRGTSTSPRPKQRLALRPAVDSDPRADLP